MDQVEEIKQRVDIVDLISSYIELKKAGANFKAICPFHSEKTPSFMVSQDKGIFKCFGCDESGDIFSFVEKMEGVDFPEALKILAERAGVKLEKVEKRFYDQKRSLYEINNKASDVFHHLLINSKNGVNSLKYLGKRGISKKTIENFKIGYAPQNYEFLSRYLVKKGFREGDIVLSGLALRRDRIISGRFPLFDRFRGRIMFPILNPVGNVIAFSGRLLEEQEGVGKYINSPETPVFSKSRTLYALDKAKTAIRKTGAVILVEGPMDAILSYQAGFANTVASSGTALTQEQVEILRRVTCRFLFAFDADNAGTEATKRGVELVLKSGGDVLIINIPKGFKDSADVIRKDPSLWREAIENAMPYIEYLEEKTFSKYGKVLSPEDKRDISLSLLPEIANISNPIISGEYLSRLASRLKTEEKYLYESIAKIKENTPAAQRERGKDQREPTSRENHLLALILVFPDYFNEVINYLHLSDFNSPQVIRIYKKLKLAYSKKRKFNLKQFTQKLISGDRDFVNLIVLDVENEYAEGDESIAQNEIISLAQSIKGKKREEEKRNFSEAIKKAEVAGDREKIKQLIKKFQEIVIKK
jgi:DNA primase